MHVCMFLREREGEKERGLACFEGVSQPLGLTEKRSVYVTQHSSSYDDIRWIAAERRTAELLSLIEPNIHSERQRKAVAEYVKDLIHKCLDCQVIV